MAQQRSTRSRLMIDLSPDLRRRIRVAAARRDISVRKYVESILEGAVPDVAVEASAVSLPLDARTTARIDALRERIMRGRVLKEDSARLLHEIRSERLEQL